ncbi:hypothetical protein NDU88_006347 [Pleurodeles waltl]|uniref:Secreted protein n=1 Tax=Pleurodeles waltl TaxID=8319 RepID=A0AAV7LSB1_PLEWA|nr:hypothetical protein NDU88_006347 [Pleurodeles waltl]
MGFALVKVRLRCEAALLLSSGSVKAAQIPGVCSTGACTTAFTGNIGARTGASARTVDPGQGQSRVCEVESGVTPDRIGRLLCHMTVHNGSVETRGVASKRLIKAESEPPRRL